MLQDYYYWMFLISFCMTMLYAAKWHKHFDIHIALVFVLVPITNLGFVFQGAATDVDSYIIGTKIGYIGGCYLEFCLLMSILNLCHFRVRKLWKACGFLLCSLMYLVVLTIGYLPVFYRNTEMRTYQGKTVFIKEYGPLHSVFWAMISLLFAVSIGVIIYSWFRRTQVSRVILILVFIPEFIALFAYFPGRMFVKEVDLLPVSYVIAQIMYLLIVQRINLYDISDTVIDSMVQSGETGFVSFDLKLNYLGSNGTAKRILPELSGLTVDRPISNERVLRETLLTYLNAFRQDESNNLFYYRKKLRPHELLSGAPGAVSKGYEGRPVSRDNAAAEEAGEDNERIYVVSVHDLFIGKKKKGYQFFLADDTKNQKYISLIHHYNSDLEAEVRKKTDNLNEMHNRLILGMATMVESRDNSTGGHIRRTSEGVRILIGEMKAKGDSRLTDTFCANLIKAAPMHDLGKIAVDDAVLRKPGRFTAEEFEKMKTHAAEGARIVHEILKETDDSDFRVLAENVAHFHHERWDGTGYPEGLKENEIPLEARIMAVADVYDALVSKRVYKEKMSYEKADGIIMGGMGTQFDPGLKEYYESARPKLEAYYDALPDVQ